MIGRTVLALALAALLCAAAVAQEARPPLQLTNLEEGDRIPAEFVLEGVTSPHAEIQVEAFAELAVESFVEPLEEELAFSGKADPEGRFQVLMDTRRLENDERLFLTITATAEAGRSEPLELRIRRQ